MTREPTAADEPTAYVSVPSITSNGTGPHVAPPASATAGTGRATAVKVVDDWLAKAPDALMRVTLADRDWLARAIERALSTERQRGLAEGERIGIEKAAKAIGEIADKLAQRPEWTVAEVVDLINEMPLRVLNTGDKPEVDPNAWAFKNGLEST